MKHFEFNYKAPSGVNIYAQGWTPDTTNTTTNKPKAVVLLIHGLGEHSGRYQHVAQFFTDKNMVVLANDRSGHGKSGGKRGHIAKYEQTLDDIEQLHNEATRQYPQVPVFVYGHSMGGGIVLNYLLRKKNTSVRGIIATAPALKLAFEPNKLLVMIGKLMRGIYPGFTQNNQLDVNQISRDKAVVEAYVKDPLVHSKITSETGLGLLEWGKYAIEHAGEVKIPVLLMHGSADGLTSPEGTKEFAAKAKGDVTLKIWDGLYHEIHNEPEQKTVLEEIAQWIFSKIK